MPPRKRRILVRDDGELLKKTIGHHADYWSIETDERFSVFISTDGQFWAIIEGATAVLIPEEILKLIIDTRAMYREQLKQGRVLRPKLGAQGLRGQQEKKKRQPIDAGKVMALWDGGWTVEQILEDIRVESADATEEQIVGVIRNGRSK